LVGQVLGAFKRLDVDAHDRFPTSTTYNYVLPLEFLYIPYKVPPAFERLPAVKFGPCLSIFPFPYALSAHIFGQQGD